VIEDKIQAVAGRMVNAYPAPLELTAVIDADRVVYIGTVHDNEGPYPIAGFVTLDELVELDESKVAALVLMRSMLDDYVTEYVQYTEGDEDEAENYGS
jgi:hypothetical protein